MFLYARAEAFPLEDEKEFIPADGIGSPDAEGNEANHGVDNEAGAAGGTSGAVNLSEGALIAIIVVVSVIAVLGTTMAILFYVAKKREWKMREKMRQSARKVVNALTPRRSEFPREVKDSSMPRHARGRKLSDDVPPTPRLRPEDIEKGMQVNAKVEAKKKTWLWK